MASQEAPVAVTQQREDGHGSSHTHGEGCEEHHRHVHDTSNQSSKSKSKKKGSSGSGGGSRAKKEEKTKELLFSKLNELQAEAQGQEALEKEAEKEVSTLLEGMAGLSTSAQCSELRSLHQQLLNEYKETQRQIMAANTAIEQLVLDKTAVASEISRSLVRKEKMEKVCREMQQINKRLQDDNESIAREEAQRRTQQMEKFQTHLEKIKEQTAKDRESLQTFALENEELQAKMQQFMTEKLGQEAKYQHTSELMDQRLQALRERCDHQKRITEGAKTKQSLAQQQVQSKQHLHNELQAHLQAETEKYNTLLASVQCGLDQFEPRLEEINKRIESEYADIAMYKQQLANEKAAAPGLVARKTEAEKKLEERRQTLSTLQTDLVQWKAQCQQLQADRRDLQSLREKYPQWVCLQTTQQ
eukprot:comp15050_c0_seq1/m.11683 comp15050_c0_seq1/g.11683  ORF comp15050_c0_seq1/g.11683 comp15050_c0_seq1/m.11683 type:complete len:416 (-) comp15050_c0_seq1:120-1367(-)